MYRRLLAVVIVTCGLLIGVWGAATARSVVAAPLSGTLTVNSTADTNTSDSNLTLREALLIARGGTNAGGLNRALSNSEKAQLSGCTIDGTNHITGGCGAGLIDTLVFNIPIDSVITLSAMLPVISDTARTTLNGNGRAPIIDAANLGMDSYGLNIASDNNLISGIVIRNSSATNIYVSGNSNHLQSIVSIASATSGVYLAGDFNLLADSHIGLNASGVCAGNSGHGVQLGSTSISDTLKNNTIGCNYGSGVYSGSSNTSGLHTLGPGNFIGTTAGGAQRSNLGDGLYLATNGNYVLSNTIAYNGRHGVNLVGDLNYVGGNTLRQNDEAGVQILGPASHNVIGALDSTGVVSNTIRHNLGNGVQITGTTASYNTVIGNYIGLLPDGTLDGNSGHGVLVDGAHDNFIGGGGVSQSNYIGGNTYTGVTLQQGAYNNHLSHNYIGGSGGEGFFPNGSHGVMLQSGAHHNVIGATNAGNEIAYNTDSGVFITGASTANNTLDANHIDFNGLNGVVITGSAHDTVLGSIYANWNTISSNAQQGILLGGLAYSNTVGNTDLFYNGQNGLLLQGGAHDNTIGHGAVGYNQRNGIEMDGAATTGNIISGTAIYFNGLDGINTRNGATGIWTKVYLQRNGGLPIDTDAPDDATNLQTDPFPTITSFAPTGGNQVISGMGLASPANNYPVEVYDVPTDGSSYIAYDGTTLLNTSGEWSSTFPDPGDYQQCYRAFETFKNSGQTVSTEFGPMRCNVYPVMLPLVVR